MKRNAIRRIKVLASGLMILGAMYSSSALADCALAAGISTVTVAPAEGRDVLVDSTLAPGTLLGRQGQATETPRLFNCTAASNTITLANALTSVANNGLFELTVGGQPSGVGIRLFVEDSSNWRQFPYLQTLTVPAGQYAAPVNLRTSLERTTNPVLYGQTNVVQFADYAGSYLYNAAGQIGSPIPYRRVGILNFNLIRPSCTMDTASLNQTVPLGNYNIADFAGSTPSTWVPFNLVMANCTDPTILADITFGITSDADANNNALFSMNTGGPGGLGIAIATAGTSSTAMLPGQTQTFPTVLSGQNFPFQARLEHTTGAVTAGAINRPVVVVVNFR